MPASATDAFRTTVHFARMTNGFKRQLNRKVVASERYMLRRLAKARRTTKAGSAIDKAVSSPGTRKKPAPIGRH
jgi:hypothetical protein